MDSYLEDIISDYVEALNTGNALPVNVYLAQFADLSERTNRGLTRVLETLIVTRQRMNQASQLSADERRRNNWLLVEARLNQFPGGVPTPTPETNLTVGESLIRALSNAALPMREFDLPGEILLEMVEDGSPLHLLAENPQTRSVFAQRYAPQDSDLAGRIVRLVNRLARLWRGEHMGMGARPLYGRPAPPSTASSDNQKESP
jgi:hypothetical protein